MSAAWRSTSKPTRDCTEAPTSSPEPCPQIRAYSAGKGRADADTVNVDEVFPEMIYGADLYRDDINKIISGNTSST